MKGLERALGLFVESTGDDFDSLSGGFVLALSNREYLSIQIERESRRTRAQTTPTDTNRTKVDRLIPKGDLTQMLHTIREVVQAQPAIVAGSRPEETVGLTIRNRNHPPHERTGLVTRDEGLLDT